MDRDEVDQFLELLNVHVELLDGCRVGVDIFLDGALGLEETLQSGLAQGHLLELSLLLTLNCLSLAAERFLFGAATQGVHHGLDVEHLTTEHHPRILEWIAPFFNVVRDLLGKVLSDRVGQDALGSVSVTVRVDRHILERHHVQVNLLVVLVGLLVVDRVLTELLSLFLERHIGLGQEGGEVLDLFLVGSHLLMGLVFVDREVETEFLKDLDGALLFKGFELASDFTSATSKDLEFFALQEIFKVRQLADELLKEDATSLYELSIVIVLHFHVRHVNGECNFLWNSRDEAARPALDQDSIESLKLIESPLASKLALGITTCHCVLGHFAYLHRVAHSEHRSLLFGLVLVVFLSTFNLLALRVESLNFLNQVGLCVVCACG